MNGRDDAAWMWARARYDKGSDALSAEGYTEDMADGIRVTFGSRTTEGKDTAYAAAVQNFERFASVRHDLHEVWRPKPDMIIVEATVNYTFKSGQVLALPVVTIFRFGEGDLIEDLRVYIDSMPLYKVNKSK